MTTARPPADPVPTPVPTAAPPGPFPSFEPHPLLRSGHLQTLAGRYFLGQPGALPSTRHEIELDDGDRLVALDTAPAGWGPGDPVVLFVHGLGGSGESPYVVRIAGRLLRLGPRIVRLNLRGAGSGFGLARGIYHAGRTDDLRVVLRWLTTLVPGSPIALIGFSLGGNLVLKLAGEADVHPIPTVDCLLAVNPPIDLESCCNHMRRPGLRAYDRHFVRMLRGEIERLHAHFPDLGPLDWTGVRSLYDFDDRYTAPRNNFDGALDYYRRSSAGPLIERISLPGLVIHSADDPFIPPDPFETVKFPINLPLELASKGGHLGYVSRHRWGDDHRWLDARLCDWLASRWGRAESASTR